MHLRERNVRTESTTNRPASETNFHPFTKPGPVEGSCGPVEGTWATRRTAAKRQDAARVRLHDVKKPAARLGFGVFGDFTLQTPKTRPPTPLGHRVFGCTKNHDLGLHLRVSVPQQCLRGLLWPYEARHRLKLLHRRQASPTGDPRMLSAQTSAPRSGSGTSPERTCANARPSPSSSGFQAFWAQREGL